MEGGGLRDLGLRTNFFASPLGCRYMRVYCGVRIFSLYDAIAPSLPVNSNLMDFFEKLEKLLNPNLCHKKWDDFS